MARAPAPADFAALKALVRPHPDLTLILDVSEATARGAPGGARAAG